MFRHLENIRTLTHGHNFLKYSIPGSLKFLSFFHHNFHLNPLRCRCKNSKRFLNFRSPKLPHQSSANCYKTLERSFGNGSPPQGIMDLVCFSRPKELYLVLEATKFHLERGGRNRIGRREKWPKKSWEEGEIGGKSREEGEKET